MSKQISLRSLFILIVAIVSLLATLAYFNRDEVFRILSQASGEPANLVIDVNSSLGGLLKPWAHVAQGGEDLSVNMLEPVAKEIKTLAPETIRLDHLYDGYNIVGRNESGQLTFNWSRLDDVVHTIRQAGATPMLSLSYMPPVISRGDIVDLPKDWNEWALVVQKTIEHYSGTLGIPNIAYEVWNEPDLYGNWKTYGAKNYLDLYRWAAIGASRAQNVKPFKLGGPATTAPYDNWVDSLMGLVETQKLRIDFISWHRYAKDIDTYTKDRALIDQGLERHREIGGRLERYVTEWGPDSNNDPSNDSDMGAAHLIAVVRSYMSQIDRLYTFEVVDGKNTDGKEYWGRWGLITHPSTGGHAKPRYQAIQFLNKLSGTSLAISGEGGWVKAISTKKSDGTIQILVTNYDQYAHHSEQAPLSLTGLAPGSYSVSLNLLGGGVRRDVLSVGTDRVLHTTLNLSANTVLLVEVAPQ